MTLTFEDFVGPGAGVLEMAFDRFPFGVAVFAAVRDEGELVDFACVYVNAGLERVTGLPAGRFVGQRLLEVVPAFREGGEFDAYKRALEEGEPWDTEIAFDDDISATRVAGRFAMRAMGFGDGVICTYEDVTELRLAQEELRRSHAELERFADIAAHDLREPLIAVARFAELLGRGDAPALDGDRREIVDHIEQAAAHGRRLVDGLRDYARVGRGEPARRPVDLDRLVTDLVETLAPRLEEAGASVTVAPLPTVVGEAADLSRVFQNLVLNAVKFRGEDAPAIAITARRGRGELTLSVRDNGPGVPESERARIFEIFTRGGAGNDVAGTGIGLAVCQKIVDRHAGRIWVEPAPAGGSVFCFTLPDDPRRPPARPPAPA